MGKFSLSPRQLAGLTILLLVLGFAFIAPLVWPTDPLSQDLTFALREPSLSAPLGFDHLGRSQFARLSAALQLSLGLAAISVFSALLPGLILGVTAAWSGGAVDRALNILADVCMALPGLLLVLMLAAIVPDSTLTLYIGLSLVLWVEFFRVSRATVRPLLSSPAVEASRLMGFNGLYIFRHHLWPAIAPLLITLTLFSLIAAIMAISALGFISVGIRPPAPELGMMMTELLPWYHEAPWALFQPVAALFLLLLGLTLIADKERA